MQFHQKKMRCASVGCSVHSPNKADVEKNCNHMQIAVKKSWNRRDVDSKYCKGAEFIKTWSKYRENVVRIGKSRLNVCVWLFKALRHQIGAEEWPQKWHEGCDKGEVIPEAGWGRWALSAWDSPQISILKKQIFSFPCNQPPCNIFINAAGGTGSTM